MSDGKLMSRYMWGLVLGFLFSFLFKIPALGSRGIRTVRINVWVGCVIFRVGKVVGGERTGI